MPGVPRPNSRRVRIVRKVSQPTRRAATTTTTKTIQSRRRKPQATKSLAPPSRTLNSVEQSLRNAPKFGAGLYGMPGMDYIKCRFDPFNAPGSHGIPDGAGGKRILQDHRMYADLTIGSSGSMLIKALPTLPYAGAVKLTTTDTSAKINGTTINANSSPGTFNYSWIPILSPTEWIAWTTSNIVPPGASRPAEILNPYAASRARIVTMALRLTYTGAASTAQGLVTIQSDRFMLQESATINQEALTMNNWNNTTDITLPTDLVMERRFDTSTSITSLKPGAVTFRPEQTIYMLMKHASNDYKWCPMYATPVVLRDSSTQNTWFCGGINPGSSSQAYCGICMIDPEWESADVIITGAAPGATYRLECVQCVEYEPMSSSGLYTFAKDPPENNAMAINAANNKAKDAPIAVIEKDPWFKNAIRQIGQFIWQRTGANPENLQKLAHAFASGMKF
jgi:hypothetical protein